MICVRFSWKFSAWRFRKPPAVASTAGCSTASRADLERAEALAATDRIVGMLADATGPDDLLVIMPLVVPEVPDEPSAFSQPTSYEPAWA